MTNRLSQSEVCFIVTLANLMIDLERIMKKSIPEEEIAALAKIMSSFGEYRDLLKQRADSKSTERVSSKVRNYHPMLVPNASNKKERISLLLDDFYCLAEQVLEASCKGCDGKNGECSIQEALQRNFVPEFVELDEDHPCYYMYEDKGKK